MINEPKTPPPPAPRLALDSGLIRQAIDAGVVVLARQLMASPNDEKALALNAALRAVHVDLAAAEYDSKFTRPPARTGGETLAPRPAFLEAEEQPS